MRDSMAPERSDSWLDGCQPWHRLLAPLPAGAVPERQAAGPAGWENVTLMLSAGDLGLRHLLVVLDETGRPISAADLVLHRHANEPGPARFRQESIGGRLELDGRFLGTCWVVSGPEPADDEPPGWDMTPRPPTDPEVAVLKALVTDLLGRLT